MAERSDPNNNNDDNPNHDHHPTKEQMVIKIGVLGDIEVGKSSFMRRYVSDTFQHSSYGYYNNSPGSVLFLEKQISMKQIDLFMGLWCSTTYSIYESALQIICNEANIIMFMFSLINKSSLNSIKLWYEKALSVNKKFIPVLVGTKYDIVRENIDGSNPLSHHYLNEYHKITRMARKYAMKMKASLIYISAKDNTNINHLIKSCVAKVFNIKPKLKEYHWDTLKPLREHNTHKLLKCWSNGKRMRYLVNGYLKRENLLFSDDESHGNNNGEVIIQLVSNYLKYNLQPSSKHHHERGKKSRKTSSGLTNIGKHHRKKKSSRISTDNLDRKKKTHHRKKKSSRISTDNLSTDNLPTLEKTGSEKRKSGKSHKRKSSKKKRDKEKRRKSSKKRKSSKIMKARKTEEVNVPQFNDLHTIPQFEPGGAQSSNASSFMDQYEGFDPIIEGDNDDDNGNLSPII